jgi:hypothetical protein
VPVLQQHRLQRPEVHRLSDGGAGGAFGYIDGLGQFVVASNPEDVTHYRAPSSPGPVTITATVDDIPEAIEDATGSLVPTYDDQPVTVTEDLTVGARYAHIHLWQAVHDIPPPSLRSDTDQADHGAIVALLWEAAPTRTAA